MHINLESQVWRLAQTVCTASEFEALLVQAVGCFKRVPGYDPLVRLHASDTGHLGLQVLRGALIVHGGCVEPCTDPPDYLEIRFRLKECLRYHLQSYLVQGGHANDEMVEDLLGRDLGL